jgi:DNA polymerase V
MNKVYALVDCNNFYASCERSFNPKLKNKPIIILSNNDGCIIARSDEAKKIGIPMGSPIHECRDLAEKNNAIILSSNFVLYGDISDRVMSILRKYTPDLEIYSIDEAFLELSHLKISNYSDYASKIVEDVKRSLGIPISIGIAPTKTLAKLANRKAKKNASETLGVLSLMDEEKRKEIFHKATIDEVWGIGWRSSSFFNKNGIYTVEDFVNTSETWVRSMTSVTGSRTQLELKGIPCIEIDSNPDKKKGILSSRSFRNAVEDYRYLAEAVASYTARAAEKLREDGQLAKMVTVFLMTNKHKDNLPQYSNSCTEVLPYSTFYTPDLVKYALDALKKIYQKGYEYKKAGIYLTGLVPTESYQPSFLYENFEKKTTMIKIMDVMNHKHGRDTLTFAAQGTIQPWRMKQENTSQNYTTSWEELILAK